MQLPKLIRTTAKYTVMINDKCKFINKLYYINIYLYFNIIKFLTLHIQAYLVS